MIPMATGTLAATPLAHALIYARNRRLTGRLALTAPDGSTAAFTLWRGSIAAVETIPLAMCPGGFFGSIVYELGYIDSATLDASLLEIAKTKRLHGEVLIERNAITPAQRDEGLVEQIHRRTHHLFSVPETTTYAFFDARAPVPASPPPIAVDCVGAVWRGIRDYPPMTFVDETIQRIGDSALRVTAGTAVPLPAAEGSLLRALADQPMTLAEMKARVALPPSRVDCLAYLLVIAKCVESVSGARTHPSTGALPVSMKSGPVEAPAATARAIPTPVEVKPVQPSADDAAPSVATSTLLTPADLGFDGVVLRAERVTEESYFEVLGISDGASGEAVRAAFMRLTKAWDPERLDPALLPIQVEVKKIFAHMTHAQRTLCDVDARRAYVASRSATGKPRARGEIVEQIRHAFAIEQYPLAIQLCDELMKDAPNDAEANALHAWASVRAGDAHETDLRVALTKLDRAVSLDRTCPEAVFHRGLLYKRLANVPAAFRDFARAMHLDPKHVGAEREVRIYAMRVRKGSSEHNAVAPILEKLSDKK
jgi:hypothetical protein